MTEHFTQLDALRHIVTRSETFRTVCYALPSPEMAQLLNELCSKWQLTAETGRPYVLTGTRK